MQGESATTAHRKRDAHQHDGPQPVLCPHVSGVHEVGKLRGGDIAVVGMVAVAQAGAGMVAPDHLIADGRLSEGGKDGTHATPTTGATPPRARCQPVEAHRASWGRATCGEPPESGTASPGPPQGQRGPPEQGRMVMRAPGSSPPHGAG